MKIKTISKIILMIAVFVTFVAVVNTTKAQSGSSFDFSLSNGGNRYITAGGTVTNNIDTTLVTGTASTVKLFVSSITNSSGVNVFNQANGISTTSNSLSVNPVTPTQSSDLTLTASASVPAGTYTVNVTGIANNSSNSECPSGQIYLYRSGSYHDGIYTPPNGYCGYPKLSISSIVGGNPYKIRYIGVGCITSTEWPNCGSTGGSTDVTSTTSIRYRVRSIDGDVSDWFGYTYNDNTGVFFLNGYYYKPTNGVDVPYYSVDCKNIYAYTTYSGSVLPKDINCGYPTSDLSLIKPINAIDIEYINPPQNISGIKYRVNDGSGWSAWTTSGFAVPLGGVNSALLSIDTQVILDSSVSGEISHSTSYTVTVDPYGLAVADGATSNCTTGSISLTWNKVSGIDHYKIYRAVGAGAESVLSSSIAQPSGSTATYTDGSLASGAYTYRVEGILANGTVSGSSQPQTWLATPDSSKCLSCNSLTVSPNTINSNQSATLTWSSSNASSCTLSDGNTISTLTSGSMTVNPGSSKTYTLSCTNASSVPNQCTLNTNLTVTNNNSNVLPLWLNGDTNTSSITVRPGQNFGINWKASGNIQNLVSGSCIGVTRDSNGNSKAVSNWSSNDPDNMISLPDDHDSLALNTSLDTKGTYTLRLSCDRDNGTSLDTINSNEVKVRVVQPIIQEK